MMMLMVTMDVMMIMLDRDDCGDGYDDCNDDGSDNVER